MASLQNLPPERHLGFQCLNCQVADFRGRRYSCALCPDYHVCGVCFDADLVPEVPPHLYYHPLKVYYARDEYQLYFNADGENYSIDNPMIQSYKCALCELRGLTSFDLYKHLSEFHRSHRDYKAYVTMVSAYYQAELLVAPDALPQEDELDLRERRAIVDVLLPPGHAGGTIQPQPRRGFCADGLTLAQLLVHLKMLNLTSPEFPIRCVEILKRANALRAQQTGQEVVKTVEKYISLIEHEVATGLGERRLRLGRTSNGPVRLLQRSSGVFVLPNASNVLGLRPATSRQLTLPRRQGLGQDEGRWFNSTADNEAIGLVESLRKHHRAQQAAKPPKASQDTEETKTTDRIEGRFLCAKFIADNKPPSRNRVGIKQLKANFTEAILCSMLAEEQLSELPLKLFGPDAIKNLPNGNGKKKVSPFFWVPLPRKTTPLNKRSMKETKHFYKALDEYKAWADNLKIEADKNRAVLNGSMSEQPTSLNSHGNGDGSAVHGNGNQMAVVEASVARSDAELLELTMASIIQGIDAIIDDDDDDYDEY